MATKNLEKYYIHRPVSNLTSLAAVSTVGRVNGLVIETLSDGFFQLQIPSVKTPNGRDVIAGNGGGVWVRLTLAELITTTAGAIDIASGGTGGVTQQEALNSIAGSVTAAQFLRGDGANIIVSAIQPTDVPILNQNTTGTAGNITGVASIANGGTNASDQQTALNNLAGAVTSGQFLRGDASNVSMSAIQPTDVPALNQDTTGTAAKATNISGGSANKIPYQTGVGVTSFINAAANSALVTDGSNVPSLSNTLPAVNSGGTICSDPATGGFNSLDTALLNVYNHADAPDLTYASAYNDKYWLVFLDFNWQAIPNTTITLTTPGRYLITYKAIAELIGTYKGDINRIHMAYTLYEGGANPVIGTMTTCCHINLSSSPWFEYPFYNIGSASCSFMVDVGGSAVTYQLAVSLYSLFAFDGTQHSISEQNVITATRIGASVI